MAAVTAAGQLLFGPICYAQEQIDIVTFFHQARRAGRDGLARKTKAVDVRAAKVGEIIETVIKGEGKETQSPPAKGGDKVVRNRCPATGNEEILVTASKFTKRYTGTTGVADANGWLPYRPRGVQMRFVLVPEQHGEFSFIAPWGEKMVARPGDAIVQDLKNLKDTYRVQKVAFACTYEVIRQPRP